MFVGIILAEKREEQIVEMMIATPSEGHNPEEEDVKNTCVFLFFFL